MRTLLELDAARHDLVTTSRSIVDKAKDENERALTGEETSQLAAYQRDITAVDVEITSRKVLDGFDNVTAVQMDTLNVSGRKTTPGDPNNTGEPPRIRADVVPYQKRFGRLKAFKGPDAELNAYRSANFIRAALFNNEKSIQECRRLGIDYRAMSIGVNTAGGFTVPEEMSAAIIDLREVYGVFRQECDVEPMNRDIMSVPRVAGAGTAAFVGENTAIAESETTWNQVNLTAHKAGRIARMSSEIAEDSIINMADKLAEHFAYSFALLEDNTGFIGDGTAAYAGIRGLEVKIIDGTHTAGAVDAASGNDSVATITTDDLTALMGTLPGYAHAGAKWFCSQLVSSAIFGRLQAIAGGNTIQTLEGKISQTFLGHPIVVSQTMFKNAAATAMNNVAGLLFGNLKLAATLGDRRQFTMALSTDRYFVEDQVAIKATERFDINVHDLGDNTTAGPIVALIGQT